MNKQINHIVYAHLLVAALATGFFIFKNLPEDITANPSATPESTSEQVVVLRNSAQVGKTLFQSKCASCHSVFEKIQAPPLKDFESRGPWADRQQLYKWVRNPELFMSTNVYVKEMRPNYSMTMTAFPGMTDAEIDAVVDYINERSRQQ